MSTMIHVALFVPSLCGGGAERAVVTLANGFSARGLRVDLVLASAEGAYLSDVKRDVRIVNLKSPRVSRSLGELIRYFRREKPQVVLSALSHTNVITVLARSLSGVKTQLVLCEHTNIMAAGKRPQSFRQRCLFPLMRRAYRRADAIVAVSEGAADGLARALGLPRDRISVAYNPVVTPDLERYALQPLEHPWFQSNKPPVLLAAGRLNTAKDYPLLLFAFAKVKRRRDCRLVILGEGELRPVLEALVDTLDLTASVQMPGFVDNPFQWMRRASVFVLSSAWEGLPTVLIEAMACGTRVVSTDCPSGPREILEGGKWGALVPVGDVDQLADQIVKALDATEVPDVAARGSQFSVESSVTTYLDLIRGLPQ